MGTYGGDGRVERAYLGRLGLETAGDNVLCQAAVGLGRGKGCQGEGEGEVVLELEELDLHCGGAGAAEQSSE